MSRRGDLERIEELTPRKKTRGVDLPQIGKSFLPYLSDVEIASVRAELEETATVRPEYLTLED